MPLPSMPEEREQGAVQEQEAIEANAPPSLEATPVQMDEAALQTVAPQSAVVQVAQQPPVVRQGYTVKNPYMLLPSNVNFANAQMGPTPKTPTEQRYDAGLLFEVLSKTSPVLATAANELLGKKHGNLR